LSAPLAIAEDDAALRARQVPGFDLDAHSASASGEALRVELVFGM
jgi:hypothetical protein